MKPIRRQERRTLSAEQAPPRQCLWRAESDRTEPAEKLKPKKKSDAQNRRRTFERNSKSLAAPMKKKVRNTCLRQRIYGN
ncbi:MAG: hypothetical protein R2911_28315 [Caldilineaceae bacterium]